MPIEHIAEDESRTALYGNYRPCSTMQNPDCIIYSLPVQYLHDTRTLRTLPGRLKIARFSSRTDCLQCVKCIANGAELRTLFLAKFVSKYRHSDCATNSSIDRLSRTLLGSHCFHCGMQNRTLRKAPEFSHWVLCLGSFAWFCSWIL